MNRRELTELLDIAGKCNFDDINSGRLRKVLKTAFWTAFGANEEHQGRDAWWKEAEAGCEDLLQLYWKDQAAEAIANARILASYLNR